MDRVVTGILGSAVVLAVCAYLTRAGGRRFAAALAGGVAAALVNLLIDVGAHAAGWWRYPQVTAPNALPWIADGFAAVVVAASAVAVMRLLAGPATRDAL